MLSGLRHANSTASHRNLRRFQIAILSRAAKILDFLTKIPASRREGDFLSDQVSL